MKRTIMWAVLAAAVVGAVAAGAMAVAGAGGDSEGSATGPQADKAVERALEATNGGTANAVERDSEHGGTWEVEITRTDGVTVDVRLDENYEVIMIEVDEEEAGSDDGADDEADGGSDAGEEDR